MKQTRLFGGECMPSHRNRISYDTVKKSGLICGIIYAVIGFFVRLCVKNPYNMIHLLGADAYLPPLWLFNLLSLFWLFISGFAAGIVIGRLASGRTGGREEISVYRGLLFFIALFFLSLIWYPLLFGGVRLGLSLLAALLCIVCSAACGLAWRCAGIIPGLFMLANAVWRFYIFMTCLLVILQN